MANSRMLTCPSALPNLSVLSCAAMLLANPLASFLASVDRPEGNEAPYQPGTLSGQLGQIN